MSQRVGLVIPVRHEEAALDAVLAEIPPGACDWTFVVLHSPADPSGHIAAARGAEILVQTNPGYGAACWEGALAAIERGAEVVAFMDGDHSDPPSYLPLVLGPIHRGEADLSLGCRDMSRSPLALPPHARLGNALVTAVLSLILRRRIRDLPSMKAIRAAHLARLDLREMSYGFTIEMILKSARARLGIAQVPVPYRPRLGGHSKISGTVGGTVGATWKLCTCPLRYSVWRPEGSLVSGAKRTADV